MAKSNKRRTATGLQQPAPPQQRRRAWVLPLVGALALVAVAAGAYWQLRPKRRNLLLITIDTLRADHVGAYGHAGAATPTLDGLAARGVRFASAVASAPITGPSHATILTGLYPPQHGVRDNVVFPLAATHKTLAARLKDAGYQTAAFVAAFPVAASFGFNQGFETFDESFHEALDGSQGAERPGNEVADAAIRWLKDRKRGPFFAWAHFYDPHSPYHPPAPFDERFKQHPYDGEIAFTDEQIGRVLAALKDSGAADDTVVAVVADHGESLGDHGEQTHAILIYEATLHVPMIIAGPGVPAGQVVASRVGTVDLQPTLLRLLEMPIPDGAPGRDLRPAFRGERLPPQPLYAESIFGRLNCRWAALRAWVEGDLKLIQGSDMELFDLAKDPQETTNLAAGDEASVKRMKAALSAALSKMAPAGDSARTVAISPEQEEKLRSLGYIGGGSGGGGSLDDRSLPDPRSRVHLYERIQQASRAALGPLAEKAVGELVAIAEQDPGNPYAHFAIGNAAYKAGLLVLGAEAYAKGLALDPDRPGVRLPYGHLLRDLGRLEQSEKELRIALEQTSKDDDRTRVSLAETLTARGKLGESEPLIDAVLSRSPSHVEALAAKARLLVAQDRPADAAGYFERAAAGPSVDPLLELARLQLKRGDASAAIAAADRVLSRNPSHPWALGLKGHALVLAGQKTASQEILRRAIAARPRRPDAWLSLADAFAAAGDASAAARCRQEAERARRS